jgi:hypothetical protein
MAFVKATASTVVKDQVPEFIRDENENFTAFLKAYYEWYENQYIPQNSIEQIRDIDDTIDMFVDYFKSEIMLPIPQAVLSDKRFLAKQIKNLYLSKGTVDSYKFLFRILFNEDSEVYFPKVDMLRVSDGKWDEKPILRIRLTSGNASDLIALTVKQDIPNLDGTVTTSSARVENVIQTQVASTLVTDLILAKESIDGHILAENDNQVYTVYAIKDDGTRITGEVISVLTGFTIKTGGSYYGIGDVVDISNGGVNNSTARAEVAEIGTGSIDRIVVANGGTGYRVGDEVIFNNTNTGGPASSPTLSARAVVSEVDRESLLLEDGTKLLTETSHEMDVETSDTGAIVTINILYGGDFYKRLPLLSLPTGDGRANGKLLATSTTIGRITKVIVPDFGINYINPPRVAQPLYSIIQNPTGLFVVGETVTSLPQMLTTELGDDNILLESGDKFQLEKQQNATGVVAELQDDLHLLKLTDATSLDRVLLEDGSGYLLDSDEDVFVQEGSGQFTERMRIRSNITNNVAEITSVNEPNLIAQVNSIGYTVGNFIGADGKISESSKKIQDSKYYQDYSYVVKIGQSIDIYRDAVKKLLHPIGLALFGEVQIQSIIDASVAQFQPGAALKRNLFSQLIKGIIDAKVRAVGNYRTNTEDLPTLDKEKITLYITDFISSILNIYVSASEFLPTLVVPNLSPLEVYLLDLRADIKKSKTTLKHVKKLESFASLQTTAKILQQRVVQDVAGRSGIFLKDLERFKFTYKPSVAGTKYANEDGTPAFTTNTYGVAGTYPSPNFNYFTIGNTQIKDFAELSVAEIINSPYKRVNYAIETELGIVKLPASALRFSTDDIRFTWDDTFTMDADSIQMDSTAYTIDNDLIKFDLYT